MNRRELARTGLMGLCGVLFGRVSKELFVYEGNTAASRLTFPKDMTLSTWGTDSNVTCHVVGGAGSTDFLDGTEIDRGRSNET